MSEARSLILEYVTLNRGGVTCAELINRFGQLKGDRCFFPNGRPNTILLFGLSEDALAAINDLIKSKEVHLYPTSPFVYMHDGYMLNMPIAKKIGKNDYKKEHWLPCVINLGPHPKQPDADLR